MLDSRLPSVKNQEASYLNHRFDSTEEAKAQIWLSPSLLYRTFFTLALALFAKVLLYITALYPQYTGHKSVRRRIAPLAFALDGEDGCEKRNAWISNLSRPRSMG